MREPLFVADNVVAQQYIVEGDPSSLLRARDAAALHRATTLALESAFRFGKDLPVGAVAVNGESIIGRGFAGDMRLGESRAHAEVMATLDSRFDVFAQRPETVIVSVEPCDNCQDFLANQPGLKRVGYGLSRADVAERGLVRPHAEDIQERVIRKGFSYEAFQVEDEALRALGLLILDHTTRSLETGDVLVDTQGLGADLEALLD